MKKLFLTLFVVASLVSCNSDDSNGIAINSSDNEITLSGVKQDYLSQGSYYWTNSTLISAGNTFEAPIVDETFTEDLEEKINNKITPCQAHDLEEDNELDNEEFEVTNYRIVEGKIK